VEFLSTLIEKILLIGFACALITAGLTAIKHAALFVLKIVE